MTIIRQGQQGAEPTTAITEDVTNLLTNQDLAWLYTDLLTSPERVDEFMRKFQILSLSANRAAPTTAITEEQVEAGAEQITDDDDIVFIGQPIRTRKLFCHSEAPATEQITAAVDRFRQAAWMLGHQSMPPYPDNPNHVQEEAIAHAALLTLLGATPPAGDEIAEHDRISDLAAACVSAVLEACAVDCENVDGAIDRVINVIKASRAAAME
jgi:hypothetical protein